VKLAGQVALVTGSGRNMGRAIALALAQNGADVVINGVSNREALEQTVEEARALGVKAIGCLADVRDREAVDRMVAQARAELGPIDILVNCPAPRAEAPFEELSSQQWHDMLAVVLDGSFNCCQAVIGGMLELGRGTILNIIGVAGQTGRSHRAHITTAKTGLVGLSKALAYEYASRGITVNAVSPAFIARDRSMDAPPANPIDIPVGRQGRRDEVASLCCYLASEDARFITGQLYAINGGAYI
jgi:3-oxoacyl-[acyl-carrier protein] reductase